MYLNIRTAQEQIRQRLRLVSESALLDAQVLLAHILRQPRAWVLAHPETTLEPNQANLLENAVQRLEAGEPLPYVLGHWEFYGLDFVVSPAVLIPRPETELLVDHALHWLENNPMRRTAADIGTGSGCIAIALASHVPDLRVIATDISWGALQVSRQNIAKHKLADRVILLQSDLLQPIRPQPAQRFDLLCANLPYIPISTLESLDKLHREPRIALSGGFSGTDLIQRLLQDASQVLSPGGLLLLEIEATLGQVVRSLVEIALPGSTVKVLPDLAGHDRLVVAQA